MKAPKFREFISEANGEQKYKLVIITDEPEKAKTFHTANRLQEEAERIIDNKPKTKDIVINIPFRSTKSLLVTVMFPAWAWIKNPKFRFITASYSAELSIEHATRSRDVINSEWFKDRWSDVFHIKRD